jgi:formate hydrogenlyase subunit 3/multisubunit Na+/H+ antiporter MnhD subunit
MTLLLSGLFVIGLGALAALVLARAPAKSAPAAAALIVAGCAMGLTAAIKALTGAEEQVLRAAWPVPMGSFYVRMDDLSALFLAVIFFVSALIAIYAVGYMRGSSARQAAVAWPMFAALVGAMALVVVAHNAVLFLTAWEVMALSSYFLVTLNDGTVEVRNAGKTYLIATHLGTAFLLGMFLMLGAGQDTLDFDAFRPSGAAGPVVAGAVFLCAVIGFGAKAGLMPFHAWLPVAHPAAPSPVSALMSGVMVKIGIYGLLRFTVMAGELTAWWGLAYGRRRSRLGRHGRTVRHCAPRHEAAPRLPHCGEHRHHRAGRRRGAPRHELRVPRDGRPRVRRGTVPHDEPRHLYEPAVPRRGGGRSRHRDQGR